jgi:hypothetical protein
VRSQHFQAPRIGRPHQGQRPAPQEPPMAATPRSERSERPLRASESHRAYFGTGLIAGNNAPAPTISFTRPGTFATAALA